MNPTITLGSFQIHWYGLILAAAILVAYFIIRRNSWRYGIDKSSVDDFAFWLIVVGIIGARIYYVAFSYSYFSRNVSEIYKIWHGGLSIYGAILAGIIFSYFYVRKKAFSFNQLFDLLVLGLPLAQAIGRFGNYVNQEAYGRVTNLPWKIYIETDRQYHHPTFLYEALADLMIFFFLWKLKDKVKSGMLGWTYMLLYSLARFFIEPLRMDSFFVTGVRVDQAIALILFVISGSIILRMYRRNN